MHGVIFVQLNRLIRENFGNEKLQAIHQDAGTSEAMFAISDTYPDHVLENILGAATNHLNTSRKELLEAFGEFLAPQLLQIYQAFIKDSWTVMDLLENLETTIHRTVKMRDKKMQPPALKVKRKNKNTLEIIYQSKRNMLDLGLGIIRHLGKHYKEELSLEIQNYKDGKRVIVKKMNASYPKNGSAMIPNIVNKFFS